MQALSGHGNFNSKLKIFRLSETDLCTCGTVDNVNHVIFECSYIEDLRNDLKQSVESYSLLWPCKNRDLVSNEIYGQFAKFVTNAL